MIYFKTLMMVALLSPMTYADEPGPLYGETAAPTPTSHYGTGEYYANAPCPYPQKTLPNQVLSRSERIKQQADTINAKLAVAKRRAGEIEKDRLFSKCRRAVNGIIRKACGGGNEGRAEEGVDYYEDHMRGALTYFSKNLNYLETYQVVSEGMSIDVNMDRMIAGVYEPVVEDNNDYTEAPRSSCYDYALNGGVVNNQICFSTDESSGRVKQLCKTCLKPSGAFPQGVYPAKYKEYYNLQQEVAELERDQRSALAKAVCVEAHVDNAPSSGPSAEAYRRCILEADPTSTAADYCLFCDDAGKTAKKAGFDFNRWGPSLLTAGLLGLGGALAYNQVKKTRKGNWEAGYPSDDRGPVVMATYVAQAGVPLMVNSLQSAGAFGCPSGAGASGQGQVVTSGIQGILGKIFGGNQHTPVGGAMGYPGGMISGSVNGSLSGGAFDNNPNAGPWTSGNLSGSIEARREALRIAEENAERLRRRNQQDAESLNALASLEASIRRFEEQNARTNQDLANARAQASNIAARIGGGGYIDAYGRSQTGAGGSGIGNLRVGLDISGWAGVNGNAGVHSGRGPFPNSGSNWNNSPHYGIDNYDYYNSGAPGTRFPPRPNRYDGPGQRLPNYSRSGRGYQGSGSGSNQGPSSTLAVPSIGM